MTFASWPTVTFKVHVGAPLATTDNFLTVTAGIRGFRLSGGKTAGAGYQAASPTQITVDFDAEDRSFDPLDTSQTWHLTFVPGQRIQLTAGAYTLFEGFVDQWEPSYDRSTAGESGSLTISGYGPLGWAARNELKSPWEYELGNNVQPTLWWRLSDPLTTRAVNNGTAAELSGTWHGTATPAAGLVLSDSDGATKFAGADQYLTINAEASLPHDTTQDFTLSFWIRTEGETVDPDADLGRFTIYRQRSDSSNWPIVQLTSDQNNPGSTNHNLKFGRGSSALKVLYCGGPPNADAEVPNLFDGEPHFVQLTWSASPSTLLKVFIDGTEYTDNLEAGGTAATTAGWPKATGSVVALGHNRFESGVGTINSSMIVELDELYIIENIQSDTIMQGHYTAGANPWTADTLDGRLTRLLDEEGWPATWRDIETSRHSAGRNTGSANRTARSAPDGLIAAATAVKGSTVLEQARLLEQSEDGILTEYERDIVFRNAEYLWTSTRSTNVQYTLTDEDVTLTTGTYRWERVTVSPVSSLAQVAVQYPNGAAVVVDTTNETDHGKASTQLVSLLASSDSAYERANWELTKFADPVRSFTSVTVNLSTSTDFTLLDVRVGDLVRIRAHPYGAGTAVTEDVHVIGYSHNVDMGLGRWGMTLFVQKQTPEDVWIWDTSTWDGTKVWGF